jgi:DNA-binding IclR family transcriptional regulator
VGTFGGGAALFAALSRRSARVTHTVKSARRTFEVFEYFASIRRPATASEIGKALGSPQSSTSMLLHSFVELGYLDFYPAKRTFYPSPKLLEMSGWLASNVNTKALSSMIDGLHIKTRQTVVAGSQEGLNVKLIHMRIAEPDIELFGGVGIVHLMCTTALGRSIMSTWSDDAILAIVGQHNAEARMRQLWIEEKDLLADIAAIRQSGISETRTSLGGPRSYHAIATLVSRPISSEPISIGVVGPRQQILERRSRIAQTLRELASESGDTRRNVRS